MRRHGLLFFTLAALVVLNLSAASPANKRTYGRKARRLGEKANQQANKAVETLLRVINGRDPDAVGWITSTGSAAGATPVIWLNEAPEPMLLPGNPFGEATAINNDRTVTGTVVVNQAPQAFSWTPASGFQVLGTGEGLAIDDAGEIFGSAPHNGTYEAAAWLKAGQPPVFLGRGGGLTSQVTTADIYGNVAGTGLNPDAASSFSFRVLNGKFTQLPGLGGPNVLVNGMNNLGIAVGAATDGSGTVHSVYWDAAGTIHDLKAPGGNGALAVADNGVVVVGLPDGLHLMLLSAPGVIGPPLGISPTPEFLGLGTPFYAGINPFGDVSGVIVLNGNDYHAAISQPQATPFTDAEIAGVGTALQGASDLLTKLQKGLPPGASPAAVRWLDGKARLYANLSQILPPQRGQSSLTMEQTGEILYALSNSLALDNRNGPGGAPDASAVSADQLQRLTSFDTQALTAPGGDPNAIPSF